MEFILISTANISVKQGLSMIPNLIWIWPDEMVKYSYINLYRYITVKFYSGGSCNEDNKFFWNNTAQEDLKYDFIFFIFSQNCKYKRSFIWVDAMKNWWLWKIDPVPISKVLQISTRMNSNGLVEIFLIMLHLYCIKLI